MSGQMNRRTFLAATSARALAGAAAAVAGARSKPARAENDQPKAIPQLKKALLYSMLPGSLSVADRFKLAADLGFQGLEVPADCDKATIEAMLTAAQKSGVRVHSVMNSQSWTYPLSSGDPETAAKGLQILRESLRNAKALGADAVLLIPAVVTPEVRYKDAWDRSQREIRKVLPLARELGVVIAVENVGNRFLLSPLEFARYVDEFKSPWVKAYFDVGNIVFYGYPQDWIRTLGKRTVKLHLKDFKFEKGRTEWTALRDGAIDWQEVYRALKEIDFRGTATVELPGGDEAYLREVSRRVDLILTGA